MAPPYDFVTFDCYGTLIDWENGIRAAFVQAAKKEGVAIDPQRALAHYAQIEPVVEQEAYRRYADVLTETATRVAAALGWSLANDRARFLADSLPDWKPFPDTNRALEALLQSGLRLGILSNVDDALLAATRRHFTVDFELIITAEQVGSYKPAPAHFQTARAHLRNRRWIHAAESNFHDIVPTNALGIPNAWINRKGETSRPGGTPTREFRDLASFAAWMPESEQMEESFRA